MVVLRTSWRLCVNEQTVPLVKKEMPFLDPYGLAEEMDLDLEDSEVSLVDFKATGDMAWLDKVLEKPARFWLHHHNKVPSLLEIRQLIEAKKDLKKATRLVGNHKCLIPLKVRGRILYVLNDTRKCVLGLTGHPGALPGTPEDEAGALLWFLDELQKGLETLGDEEKKEVKEVPKKAVEEEYSEQIQACLESLVQHPQCSSACFKPSRLTFQVVKKDLVQKEFRVKNLNKRARTSTEPEEPFQKALAVATEYLDESASVEPDDQQVLR